MWSKLMLGAVAVMAAALFAFLGQRTITAYGVARLAQGAAEGRLAELPATLAANARATQAALDARDRVIAADDRRSGELDRLLPLILSAQDKVDTYAKTNAGQAACLGAERVRGIAADRAALFPAAGADRARAGDTRSVPPDPDADASGRKPG